MRRKVAITNLAASVAHDPMTLQPVLIMRLRSIHLVEGMMHRELEFTHEDDKKQLLKMFASRQDKLEWLDVTLSELIQGVRKAHPISFSRLLLDAVRRLKLFTRIDADGSGTVEAEEFVTPLSRSLVRPLWPALCRWVHDSKTATRFIKYNLMRTPSVSWASEGEVESPKSSALEWLQKADAEQPTDKIVTSTRLAEEDSLKAALVHAENLLVASNKELLERSLQAMKGVFHGAVQETGSPSSAKPRSMSEEHSDAPTKQKPMAYSELSEKSESSKTTDPEAPVATSQEKAFFRTAPGSSDPDCMQTDQSAAQISVSVRLKRGTRDICGI
ncbi:unnamed protein product [Symbiodinium microadriaticum]|nr:unnamed protein product [Symbiodinium microadriaticum]